MTPMTGLALDIDETLCDTALTIMHLMAKEFGTTEPFDADLFLQRYVQPGYVPDWQETPAQRRIEALLSDDTFMFERPPIKEALEWVPQIHQLVPISVYITSRVHALQPITERWLRRYHFPAAPVITRDPLDSRPDWKVFFLAQHYPTLFALVDNEIHANPEAGFKGHLLEIQRHEWPKLYAFLEKNKPNDLFEK